MYSKDVNNRINHHLIEAWLDTLPDWQASLVVKLHAVLAGDSDHYQFRWADIVYSKDKRMVARVSTHRRSVHLNLGNRRKAPKKGQDPDQYVFRFNDNPQAVLERMQ